MDKQRKTFLSYSRVNKDFAVRLARELKAEGFYVWLDQLDIPPGSRWDVEVEKALVECDIFMVIITRASSTSENVLDEIGYAIDNGKRMLPVLLEKSNIPLRLRRFQYVDFTDKNFEEGVQSAKDLLRNLIAQPTLPRGMPLEEVQDRLNRQQIVSEQEIDDQANEDEILPARPPLVNENVETPGGRSVVPAPAPGRPRLRLLGIFSISIIGLALAGFALTRFFANSPSVSPATRTATATVARPTSTDAVAALPATAEDTSTPTLEPTETQTPTLAFTATPSAPQPEIVDDQGASMVLVQASDFLMGSDRGLPDEQPPHLVFLDAFYIDKFEVTNKLYKACVEAGSCLPPKQTYFFPESPGRIYYDNPQFDNYPVIYVDWNMAKAYCEWRGARLPTEAEWEKAARGTEGLTYPWGRDLDCQKANYQNCVNRTSEVGIYEDGKSPYGAYDMTGNVWEWVADWYSADYYARSPRNNPEGPIVGQSRVLRGGAWPRFDVSTFHRNNFGPDYNTFDIGFRCARDVSP